MTVTATPQLSLTCRALLAGEHYFILEALDGGKKTKFFHGETFTGILTPLATSLGPSKAQVLEGFTLMNEGLKAKAEGAGGMR